MTLPVIDLSHLTPTTCDLKTIFKKGKCKETAKSFFNALSTYGFTYITGHGIPEDCIDAGFKASKEFFRPENRHIHTKYYRKKDVILGYVDGVNERDLPKNPIDLKQGFDFVLKCPEFEAIPGQQKEPLKILYKHFEKVSQFLLRFLGLALDQGVEYLLDGHQEMGDIEENSTSMRILYYQAVTGVALEKQSRMSDHTDFGTFTMLIQDEVGGLQVLSPNGNEFIDAVPMKYSIIFNVGDLLQSWSVGKLRSTLHRVVLPKDMVRLQKSRQSIVYFTNPDNRYVITGIDNNGNTEKKSVREHILERNNNTIFEVDQNHIENSI